jgi:hypothetical protein
LNGSVVICFGLALKLFLLVPQDHPFLDVISWITGVQQGGGVGVFVLTLIQENEGQVDLGCNVGLTLTSRSRAGDFKDIMFFVEMDSVTVVKLGNMVSPPWKKTIRERLMTLIQGHEGRVDLGCNVGLTIRSRAGDFKDIMFFVEMVTVAKLGNMVSPPWKKTIGECLEESVGRLFASLNGSVTIDIEELLPNEGWASVLPKVAILVPSHSC